MNDPENAMYFLRNVLGLVVARSRSNMTQYVKLIGLTGDGQMMDVTPMVASALGESTDRHGRLVVRGCGFCPVNHLAHEVSRATGEDVTRTWGRA